MPKDSDKTPEKPKVLDLIEDKKKPSRRERQRVEASTVKTVDDAKREALDLFAEEKKPKVRKTAQPGKSVLPTISKLRDEEIAVEAKVVADAAAAAAPPPPAAPASDIQLGLQHWTLRRFTFLETLDKARALGLRQRVQAQSKLRLQ